MLSKHDQWRHGQGHSKHDREVEVGRQVPQPQYLGIPNVKNIVDKKMDTVSIAGNTQYEQVQGTNRCAYAETES